MRRFIFLLLTFFWAGAPGVIHGQTETSPQARLRKLEILLEKNREFLKGVDANDFSKRIKIQSNMAIISTQIATLKTEIEQAQRQKKK